MGDHTIYKRPEGETTQWEDLQRKFGNLAPKEPVKKADPFTPAGDEQMQYDRLDQADKPEALEDMEDDFEDDSFLETYRCFWQMQPTLLSSCACRLLVLKWLVQPSVCHSGRSDWRS